MSASNSRCLSAAHWIHGETAMIIFLPFVLSFDSFFASFALGAFRIERSRQIKLRSPSEFVTAQPP
jgi:hypothetical protein